jgi:Asp-tRNA(Asn)/Glu-tRNA(Gln) amidotransferase B subunit
MQNLIEVIKEGRISKKLARAIIRKLQKHNVLIDPDLIDAAV